MDQEGFRTWKKFTVIKKKSFPGNEEKLGWASKNSEGTREIRITVDLDYIGRKNRIKKGTNNRHR